jgi:DNA polymerase-3 subunit beta
MNLQEEKEKIQQEIAEIDRKIAMLQERGEYELVVKELGKAIGLLNKVVPRQTSLPILQSIIVGEGFARATDLEADLKVFLETEGKGQFCIDPKALPKEVVLILKNEGDQVVVSGEKVKATIKADDPLDFPPELNVGETQPLLEVDAGELGLAIKEVADSAAKEDTRPVLTGIHFEVGENQLTLTAADGFRLATTSLSCSVANQGTLLVSAKAAKLIPLLEGSLQLQQGEGACVVMGSRGQLTVKTIQGSYPNYRHIIPDESEMTTTVIFQSKELVDGIKVVANGVANLRLYPEANAVKLVVKEDDGSREYLCPAMVSGSGKIAINPRFLLDLAKLSDSLTLSWSDPTRAMRAQTTRGLHVIMPLFVQWDKVT